MTYAFCSRRSTVHPHESELVADRHFAAHILRNGRSDCGKPSASIEGFSNNRRTIAVLPFACERRVDRGERWRFAARRPSPRRRDNDSKATAVDSLRLHGRIACRNKVSSRQASHQIDRHESNLALVIVSKKVREPSWQTQSRCCRRNQKYTHQRGLLTSPRRLSDPHNQSLLVRKTAALLIYMLVTYTVDNVYTTA